MQSSEIINNINQLYDYFRVPPNLRLHMFRVASVSKIICENWNGPKLNQDDVVAVCLMHDLGNIVKYDFDHSINLMGEEAKRVEYWKKVKEEVVAKYGKGEYEATFNMAEELGINDRLKFLLTNYKFIKNSGIVNSDDFDLKISNYGDYRVGPFGILTIQQRLSDFKERYSKKGLYCERPDMIAAIQNMFTLEKQIFDNTSIKPEDINDGSVKKYLDVFNNL
ncbi:MAG: HD domain-containing protein [Nanoarchaeota archaeon]